jgi:hypothetical protein
MRADNPDGVPLSHYLTHAGCAVRFHCAKCHRGFDVALDDVIARLRRRGLGDEHTGICAVGRLADRTCDRCGARRWETRPAFASRPYEDGVIPPNLTRRVDEAD